MNRPFIGKTTKRQISEIVKYIKQGKESMTLQCDDFISEIMTKKLF
jgi:hypothetical protein